MQKCWPNQQHMYLATLLFIRHFNALTSRVSTSLKKWFPSLTGGSSHCIPTICKQDVLPPQENHQPGFVQPSGWSNRGAGENESCTFLEGKDQCRTASANKGPGKKGELQKALSENAIGATQQMGSHNSLQPRPLLSWEDAFSYDAIVRQLAKERIKLATKSSKRLFFDRMRPIGKECSSALPEIFPPRRSWAKHRPKQRSGLDRKDVQIVSILNTIDSANRCATLPPWTQRLNQLVTEIQSRALSETAPLIQKPKIRFVTKQRSKNEFRAICEFEFVDKVVIACAQRYLVANMDRMFLDSSIGFRPRGRFDRSMIIEKIREIRMANRMDHHYVAECDLCAFFDCLEHHVILDSYDLLAFQSAADGHPIDNRARGLLQSYLSSYSFPQDVLIVKSIESMKWPEEALRQFYPDPRSERIGVPQGGALSNLIANMVLHRADVAIRDYEQETSKTVHYWRFCDDMFLTTPDGRACEESFEIYRLAAKQLRLVVHNPSEQLPYMGKSAKKYWNGKTRTTYAWGPDVHNSQYPWIGFLGFQVRCDGLIRIRASSLQKQIGKLIALTDQVLKRVGPKRPVRDGQVIFPSGISKSSKQIVYRVRRKMESAITGKVGGAYRKASNHSWAAAYSALATCESVASQLKYLDRQMERQLARLRNRLLLLGKPQKYTDLSPQRCSIQGKANSYYRQVHKKKTVKKPASG